MIKASKTSQSLREYYIREYYKRHEAKIPAIFFIGGFLFDIVTLDRIDSIFSIAQQGAYLLLLTLLLVFAFAEKHGRLNLNGNLKKLWQYQEAVVHFMFGSLLSVYTLFFFKSSSLATSITFIGLIAAILVLNELPQFQRFGIPLRFAMLGLCVTSYLFYLIPIIIGFVGFFPFLISLFLGTGWIFLIAHLFNKKLYPRTSILKNILAPPLGVACVFLILYFLQMIPPVPIALTKSGIYHSVTRDGEHYVLSYSRPWWKFWQSGAQTFLWRDGDRINFFFSVFSPNNFKDSVNIRWFLKERNKWSQTDSIPISISGGREQGFRGVAIKSNFQSGQWQVRVETNDGREIGRLYFDVLNDTSNELRSWKVERF